MGFSDQRQNALKLLVSGYRFDLHDQLVYCAQVPSHKQSLAQASSRSINLRLGFTLDVYVPQELDTDKDGSRGVPRHEQKRCWIVAEKVVGLMDLER